MAKLIHSLVERDNAGNVLLSYTNTTNPIGEEKYNAFIELLNVNHEIQSSPQARTIEFRRKRKGNSKAITFSRDKVEPMENQLLLFDENENTESPVRNLRGICGLDYYAGILSSREQVEVLAEIDSMPWQNDLKRQVQHYGYKYDYRPRRIDPSMYVGALPEFAVRIGEKLLSMGIVTFTPDQVIVNEYKPGQGITPHIDCEPCFKDTIVTISLGSVYAMDFYSIRSDDVQSIDLGLGSALVLSGDARFYWKHGIKARKTDNGRPRQRRVSLTYRNVILDDNS